MKSERKVFIVWNESKSEGVVFLQKNDAKSALDGKHRRDPELGFACISTLADHFHEIYGDDHCSMEAVTIDPSPARSA